MSETRFFHNFLWGLALSIALFTAAEPRPGFAFPTDPFNSTLQAMMLAVEADMVFLPFFALAPGAIPFTSHISPGGGSFSYDTLPGATYAGAEYSLTASGSYDPIAHTGIWTSTATLLSPDVEMAWTASGNLSPSASDPTKLAAFYTTLADFCPFCTDEIAVTSEVETIDGFTYVTAGVNKDKNGNPISSEPDEGSCTSPRICAIWSLTVESLPGFAASQFLLVANGNIDPNGDGTFVVTFSTIPEPGSLVLIFSGIASLLGISWARHRKEI